MAQLRFWPLQMPAATGAGADSFSFCSFKRASACCYNQIFSKTVTGIYICISLLALRMQMCFQKTVYFDSEKECFDETLESCEEITHNKISKTEYRNGSRVQNLFPNYTFASLSCSSSACISASDLTFLFSIGLLAHFNCI